MFFKKKKKNCSHSDLFTSHKIALRRRHWVLKYCVYRSAEIGQNGSFYFFGYHLQGIILGYIMGFVAGGFTTFMTILGRYDLGNARIDSCCSVLEGSNQTRDFFLIL